MFDPRASQPVTGNRQIVLANQRIGRGRNGHFCIQPAMCLRMQNITNRTSACQLIFVNKLRDAGIVGIVDMRGAPFCAGLNGQGWPR